jgi:hypothetical protein
LQQEAAQIESELTAQRGSIQEGLARLEGDIQGDLLDRKALIDQQLLEAEGEQRSQLQQEAGAIEAELQELRTAGQLEVTEIENRYRVIIQASQSAAVTYSEVATQIGSILANDKIKAADKNALIERLKDHLDGALSVIGGVSDLDLGAFLDFGGPAPEPTEDTPGGRGGGSDVGQTPSPTTPPNIPGLPPGFNFPDIGGG